MLTLLSYYLELTQYRVKRLIELIGILEEILPFEPANQTNAIVEVVFGLIFENALSPVEVAAFTNAHSAFADELPGILNIPAPPFQINGQPIQFPSGIVFDRYNTAGALQKRLRLSGNALFISDLAYSRWVDVSASALSLIGRSISIEASFSPSNAIVGVILQNVDVFRWRGLPQDYDLTFLFKKDGPNSSKGIFDRGPNWHLHQGWYAPLAGLSGRMLERTTIDGLMENADQPTVRFDSYLQFDLEDIIPLTASDKIDRVKLIFEELHGRNKAMIKEFLVNDMQERIGL